MMLRHADGKGSEMVTYEPPSRDLQGSGIGRYQMSRRCHTIGFNGGSGALKDAWDHLGPNLPIPGTQVTNYKVSNRAQEQPERITVLSGSLTSNSSVKRWEQCGAYGVYCRAA